MQEGRDYTIEKKGQTVTVKMTPEYVKANSSQDIVITYKTATNQKVAEKGAATIENTVTLKVDNLSAPSNQVTTDLLYEKKHEFVSGTAGKELPQEIKDLTPETEKNLENGTKATPTQPAKTEVQTADGTWIFKSYDKAEETINGADAHFVGTWDFTPAPTYKATHEFVSGTAGKELPQAVKDLLPADKPDLADGTKATPTQPTKTEVQTADGTWTFKSYDKTEETINGADAHFVGTWDFTPAPTYKATHEFVSGTAGKELPQAVKDLLPADKPNLADGTKTTPIQPAKTEVQTVDGTWTFKSYDKNEETINGADAHFVGTWEFTATPSSTYKAVHEFISGTAGKELPQEVKSLLPSDKSDLADGTKTTPTQPTKTEVKTTDGTWTFKSYDKTEETINGADAHFVGTWEFTATPSSTYKATHEFVSGTAGKELPQAVKDILPSDQANLSDGTKATPTQPVKTEVKTADGSWSFQSYDKNEATINGADVHFVGTWTFASDSTTLTGSVIWIDNDNAAGRRPKSVLVHLLADGQDTGISVTVDEAMGWKYSFENLPRFKDGKEIIYSVREDEVEGYSNQAEGMNVTNRLLVDAQVKEIGKKRILPKTGQDTSIWMLILGFLTFGGAVGLTKRQRD